MFSFLLFTAVLGVSASSSEQKSVSISITISATIVSAEELAIRTDDLGIIGVDAQRVAINFRSAGMVNAKSFSEEYLVMRRPGSPETGTIYARIDPTGTVVFEDQEGKSDPDEMMAMRWDEAKPVIAALYKKRFFLAWKKASRIRAQNG